jgi:hypothetical protein
MKASNFKVISKPESIMKDYAGMNYLAAKVMNFKPQPKPNEIYVDSNFKGMEKKRIIVHEMKELELMKGGLGYFPAHLQALKEESKTKKKYAFYNKVKKRI